jgi:hypothetical protein
MANVKSMARISDKWKRVSAGAGAEYEEGVRNPRADWATETKKAESTYEQGIQASITRKAFGKGVTKAGSDKWQKNAIAKGPGRFSTGVALAQDDYEKGFAPYREVIERTALPARGPKGDPKNLQRVAILAKALHDKKISMEGTS